ncbi:hypothetical protein GCM10007158_12710 [Vreelandella hamiltonii]|uniref:Uncharacterized protein n=1 Tax=Halomonas johnsoniae TaxID=502832 RepID=A0ABQ2WEW2_9GAMM|nr:hypothetical protein GCM10007158_12710 [Halomonas johnsoniae]
MLEGIEMEVVESLAALVTREVLRSVLAMGWLLIGAYTTTITNARSGSRHPAATAANNTG